MAPELRPESAAFVSVHPDYEPRVRGWRCAVGHSVRPVLGQPVVLCRRGQSAVRYGQAHRHVRPAAAHVVTPERRYGLFHAAFAWKKRENGWLGVFSFSQLVVIFRL